MRGRLLLVGSLVFLIWLGATPSGQQQSPGGPQAVDGELLVRFRAAASAGRRDAALAAIGGQRIKRFEAVATDHVRVPRGRRAAEAIATLLATGDVLSAQPNFVRRIIASPPPNDFFWINDTTYGFYGLKKIQADQVWAVHTNTGSSDIVVADLDTGVQYTHPDLAANMWVNPGEVAGNGVDDDANGYVDDVHGINAITHSGNPMDDHGHGTHTAGTFGAVGNNGPGYSTGTGVVGVNWTVKILACKFLDASGNGSDAGAIECFNYITAMKNRGVNVRVSNNSWGGYRDTSAPFPQLLKDAIDAAGSAGILNVFAAGNGDVNGNGVNIDTYPHDPASFTSASIVSVAASRSNDLRATFSNYGVTSVDLAAPGVSILSTWIGTDYNCYGPPCGYAYLNGTSMAAPHVAGAAALLLAQSPAEMPVAGLKSLLLGNVDAVNAWNGYVATGGRLNVFKAANQEAANAPPSVAITSPLPGATFSAPATVTITASASDATGSVTSVEFFAGAVSLGSDSSSPFSITSMGIPAGSYALTAKATDNFGATASSAPVPITVGLDPATIAQSIALGGSRLQQLQQANGGWFFSVSQTNCGLGEGVACPNLIGVTALGLLTAYDRNPADPTLLASAVAAGQRLLAVKATLPTPLPFSQDLEFLIALSDATADPQYAAAAADWFDVVQAAFPDAAARVDYGLATRGTLAGWDMASLIRSAKAGGDGDYALAAATRIFEREADWASTNPTHALLGKGSLLWAVHDLGGFDAKLTEYRDFLLAEQDGAGTWGGGNLQATAYAVMGLAAFGGADMAIEAAVTTLIANQLPTNGWPFSAGFANEYSTVDAEVLRAIAALDNTPAGSSVLVTPAQLSTVTFNEVSISGATRVVAKPGAADGRVPKRLTLVEGLSYEITTSAEVRGQITVCVAVPWAATAGAQDLRLLHLEHGRFVDRTIRRERNANPASPEVCARVTSLESFAVAVRR